MSESDALSSVPKVKDEPNTSQRRVQSNGKRLSRRTPAARSRTKGGDDDESEAEEQETSRNVGRDDIEEDSEDADEHTARKRQKTLNGRARRSEPPESDVEEGDRRASMVATKIFVRDPKDGYLPGSIVRIQCKNFLTYDFVEFSPGARMNIILGPNGTGKSTIACAICLGLGFQPNILGRAENLSSFVKHGYEQGHIEIELKGEIGKKNSVFRRNINAGTNSSTWALNGKAKTKNEIATAVAELGVQVGNLCSFLPQDRVNEFAKLKPEELLVETQKVAGHDKLLSWHETLIGQGKTMKKLKEELAAEQQECATEEGKNSILQREVDAFNKRKQLEEELAVFSLLSPYYAYKRDSAVHKTVKNQWREATMIWEDALKEHKPATDFKKRLEDEAKSKLKEARDVQADLEKVKRDIETVKSADTKLKTACDKIDQDLMDLTKSEEESRSKVRQLKQKIDKWNKDLGELKSQAEEDPTRLQSEKERHTRLLNRARLESNELEESVARLEQDIEQSKEDVRKANEQLKALRDTKRQRYSNMERVTDPKHRAIVEASPHFMQAFKWVRDHQAEFEDLVEPACFSLTVKHPKYAAAIENAIGVNNMKTFVFSNARDYRKFNDAMDAPPFNQNRPTAWYRPLPPRDPQNPGPDETGTRPEPPSISREELQATGFDGYATDFIDAPPVIKFFLSKHADLHRVAVAADGRRVDLEQASRVFSPSQPGTSSRYYAGLQLVTITRSAYGRKLVQSNAVTIRDAAWFNEQLVDQRQIQEQESKLSVAQDTITDKTAQKNTLYEQGTEIRDRERELKRQTDELTAKLKDITDRRTAIRSRETKVENAEAELVAEENRPSMEDRAMKLRANLATKVKARLENVPKLKNHIERAERAVEKFTLATFRSIQAEADVSQMNRIIEGQTARHRELERRKAELGERVQTLKAEAEEKKRILTALSADASDEVMDRVKAHQEENSADKNFDALVDRVEQQKMDTQAKLDMTGRVNQGVIQTYEQRQANIERLKGSISHKEQSRQNLEKKINRVKNEWLPQLNALIARVNERFSAAFDRIQCAGEVRLAEHEDFDKWAIEILVKFRSNEPLQLLTGQRQSGGERSLTTILYLMSLTGLAKTPFALVDEINQGMDFKYERRVHNELIQVTCAEDSGQYFLITPKLLPNLTYHENVTALVINNGDWLPETKDEKGKVNNFGDLGANLAAYRAAMRKA